MVKKKFDRGFYFYHIYSFNVTFLVRSIKMFTNYSNLSYNESL